jgi:transcription elongation factor GreA
MKKFFTKEGIDKLKKELAYLEKEKRKEVAENLKFAASFGDLSENAAYDDAKNEQNVLETKIAKLRETIKEATVVKGNVGNTFVQIGSQIEVVFDNKKQKIEIVGGSESDPFLGKISCESPMGKSFLNKKEGDTCLVKTPKGERVFKITKII